MYDKSGTKREGGVETVLTYGEYGMVLTPSEVVWYVKLGSEQNDLGSFSNLTEVNGTGVL